jgi:hypothetical protein
MFKTAVDAMHAKHREIGLETLNGVQDDLVRHPVLDEGFHRQSGPSNAGRKGIELAQRGLARHTWSMKSYLRLDSGFGKNQSMEDSYARVKMMRESYGIIERNARAFKKVSSKENRLMVIAVMDGLSA